MVVDAVGKRFLEAGISCLASSGLRGFSLRAVAQGAGGALGSLSYRFGSKTKLIEAIIEQELAEREEISRCWQSHLAGFGPLGSDELAEIISSYIDEMALRRRNCSLASSELLIGASIFPLDFPGMGQLLDAEISFWQDGVLRHNPDVAPLLGRAIAGYVRDELPFTIACGSIASYRLLRGSTIHRIAQAFTKNSSGIALHFDSLVTACGIGDVDSRVSIDLPEGSRKAELGSHLAMLIAEEGLTAVTHRSLAQRAGIPHSTVAHHFRSQEDLLYAGIAGLAVSMRRELQQDDQTNRSRPYGLAMIRASHAAALAAARDPALIPFALDMRRWRAVNVREQMGKDIGLAPDEDGAGIQAAVMALIGCALMKIASNHDATEQVFGINELIALRTAGGALNA